MKAPKFTDHHRFPSGYVPAAATDITKTFARIRRELAKAEAEKQAKVAPIRRKRA